MSMIQFTNLMTHTITLKKRKRNVYGDFSVDSSNSIKGFIEYGKHLIENDKGEKMLANAIVFLKDDCGIDVSHQYWQIDQTSPYSRLNMEVIKIDPIDDPRTGNTHHYELYVV